MISLSLQLLLSTLSSPARESGTAPCWALHVPYSPILDLHIRLRHLSTPIPGPVIPFRLDLAQPSSPFDSDILHLHPPLIDCKPRRFLHPQTYNRIASPCMFDFRSRTTSNDSSSDQSQAPLTPLPGRLSLRPNRSPSPPSIGNPVDDRRDLDSEPSLFRRASGDFEGLAELGGATFAELLGRGDVRDSIVLHASDLEMGAGSRQAAQPLQEEEVILTLPGGGWGVTGEFLSK